MCLEVTRFATHLVAAYAIFFWAAGIFSMKIADLYKKLYAVLAMSTSLKPLKFIGSSQDDLRDFPIPVRQAIGIELMVVQFGGMPSDFKPMPTVGAGAYEVRVNIDGAWRAIYVAKFAEAVYVRTRSKRKRPRPISPT
jgi:phage-related protein